MKTAGRTLALLAASAAVLTVSAVAVAGPAKKNGLLARVVHADVSKTSAKGMTVETTLDRGMVTAASTTSISLRRADGQSVTLAIGPATTLRGTVVIGARALVLSRDGTALVVRARGSRVAGLALRRLHALTRSVHADVRLIRADGSTDSFAYDRGEITARTSSAITVKRKDGKSVTLAVDSSTKVREQGKPATLADLQIGERAMFFSRDGKAFLVRCVKKA